MGRHVLGMVRQKRLVRQDLKCRSVSGEATLIFSKFEGFSLNE
jgi:hypothetical protein